MSLNESFLIAFICCLFKINLLNLKQAKHSVTSNISGPDIQVLNLSNANQMYQLISPEPYDEEGHAPITSTPLLY